jgi:Mrp family chromosome partitioning ATPase
MPGKKQSKADKAFIAKIGTLGIKTNSAKKTCPDCGTEMQPIGHLEGEVHGQKVSGPIYGHPGQHPGPRPSRAERPAAESTDEQSLSA